MNISRRPARPQDYEFLWWLHCHAIRPYVEPLWGWDEVWQRLYFQERFSPEKLEIIEADGTPIGCISVERHEDHIFLALIEVAPAHQSQGVGTKLIRELLVEADRRGLPVRLQALRTNTPARRLYERLGFVVTRETDERYFMEYPPAGSVCRDAPAGRLHVWPGRLYAWLALSRLPFHTVGVLPFILGGVLAWRQAGAFRWDVFAWGTLGVVLVMLATYYAGEYWDLTEDALAARWGRSRFAGGSQVVVRGLLPRHAPLWASLVSLLLAIGVALILQLVYHTGPWTLPFAIVGLLGGFFYSARPVRWVRTGLGELWIAFNYGWLPVAVGYYLQTGQITSLVHWLAVPIGLSIFNVILLNEFPDYPADREAGKANLTVRLGQERAALLYGLVSLGSWAAMLLSLGQGLPRQTLWLYLPILALSLIVVVQVLRGRWRERAILERLCGANLLVNLGTTAAYILALTFFAPAS